MADSGNEMNIYYIYFLKSAKNGKVYVGKTSKDPKIRLNQHNLGSNAWTKQNRPFLLIYFEKYYCPKDVSEREKFFKSGVGRRVRNAIITEFVDDLRV